MGDVGKDWCGLECDSNAYVHEELLKKDQFGRLAFTSSCTCKIILTNQVIFLKGLGMAKVNLPSRSIEVVFNLQMRFDPICPPTSGYAVVTSL